MKKFWPLFVLIFFGYLGYSLFITIFTPLFLQVENNFFQSALPERTRIFLLGIILFAYPFGQFMSSSFLGALSDRFGRRPILLVSILLSAFFYILIGAAVLLKNFSMLFLSLLGAGISEGNITIGQSAISDLTPKKELGKLFGFIYVATSISYIIGPIFGGYIASAPIFFRSATYALPFFIIAALLFLLFLWFFLRFQETLHPNKREQISYWEAFTNIKKLFFLKTFRLIYCSNFLIYLAIFGFLQTFPIYIVSQFNVKIEILSLFITWTSIPFLIVNIWLTGHISKKYSSLNISFVSAILLGFFQILFILPSSIWVLWITLFLVACVAALSLPITSLIVSHKAKEIEQGRLLGINQSVQFFSEAISGIFIGLLGSVMIKISFIFFACTSFIGAFLIFFLIAKIKNE